MQPLVALLLNLDLHSRSLGEILPTAVWVQLCLDHHTSQPLTVSGCALPDLMCAKRSEDMIHAGPHQNYHWHAGQGQAVPHLSHMYQASNHGHTPIQ